MAEGQKDSNIINQFKIGNAVSLPAGEMVIPVSVKVAKGIEMRLGAGTIPGKDGENWNDWLVQDVNEYDGIVDKSLQMKIRLLARRGDEMNTPDHLEKVHHEIEGLVETGLDLTQAAVWLERIEERQKILVQDERIQPTPVTLQHDKEAVPARDQALYIGAVFRNGQNEPYLVSPEMVVRLNPESPRDRRRFVFRNLYAFNLLYLKNAKMGSGWLNATQNYETDLRVAMEKGAKLKPEEVDKSNEFLRAAMAVTASARAMEVSEGSFDGYGKALTGGERGTDAGWQDTWDAYILHADPNKITALLADPLVKIYYDKLMSDAGLSQNLESEWHGERNQTPRKLMLAKNQIQIEKGDFLKFIRDEAKEGGFDGYCQQVLLDIDVAENDSKVTAAAAKLACDIFMVDKYTEYVNLIPKKDSTGKTDYKLQPKNKGWGGDPFDFVINPTGLQRAKNVYSGPDSVVLDILDSAIRPIDIYDKLERRSQKKLGKPLPVSVRLPIASAVTNLKTLNRQAQMVGKITGGPMAPNLSTWSGPALSDLFEGERLAAQVLGAQKIGDDEIGRVIAGAQVIRILEAKALASTLESLPPTGTDALQIVFEPEAKTRPLYEGRNLLLGPNLNFNQGHLQALQGGDYSFVIAENPFAKDDFDRLLNLLQSNDQTGTLNVQRLNRVGAVIRSGQSLARALGLVR